MNRIRSYLFALIAFLISVPVPVHAVEPYQMGVFPFLPARELEDIFAPMAASLSAALGREVQFRSSMSYRNFMERCDAQLYDIAFIQPFDYVRLADEYGYKPLASRGEELSAILVVKTDSTLKTLQDLKGKKLALPPDVAAVSRLIKAHLKKNGINPDTDLEVRHMRSHVSCLQQMLVGMADACGSAPPPVRFFESKRKTKFKKLASSQIIPHSLFIANKRLSDDERQKIRNTIMGWGNTEEGMKLLKRGRMRPFVITHDSDYDLIRKLLKTLEK